MTPEAYLLAGVVLGLLLTEITGISPGGLIVPGYVAMFLDRPERIALTAGIALATVPLVRIAGKYLLLFGRRRFAFFLLAGFAVRSLAEALVPSLFPSLDGIEAIGWIIPGIIASDVDKQGVVSTFLALSAATALVAIVAMVVR
ncbi:MAG: poly-gamma-glutamate biosynthesis protein PgsC [Spirochaetae bacterium HGW-Spirochaetae-7]|jgi:poly-gamma-glutamate biosynthesis protein PgsC/CapC|nr:MAG: poly-gamma-glutamate biosynthesis protein PgsC [Spirochaetae bacterium HGW-Spirochaetae-7]